MSIWAIVQKVACAICQKGQESPPPKPSVVPLTVFSKQVLGDLTNLNLTLMYPVLMDASQPYCHTNREGWADILYHIYTVFDMPKYIAARMDCEDFGLLLKGLVSALFGMNYFAFTVGDTPMGCHGFNFFQTEDGLVILEPQTGECFEWGERGYKPQWVLL